MPKGEILHRLTQFALFKASKLGWLNSASMVAAEISALEKIPTCNAPVDIDAAACLAEAQRILCGYVSIFSSPALEVGTTPNWNRDPKTGVISPMAFGPELAITDKAIVGEIKYVWEFNRHLHLVRLAQAYVLTGDNRYLDGLASQLESWLEQCPPALGPNWSSSLELGIRLINWFLIWRFIGGHTSPMLRDRPELQKKWLSSIAAHCRFIARHLSAYSSANNHLIGEVAGLFIAATAWPCWEESRQWADLAKITLEREARQQFFSDGVNREQATSYQIFSSEFLLIAAMQGDRCNLEFSDDYWKVLGRSTNFLQAIANSSGQIPMFGDADDGAVWLLESSDANRAKSLMEILEVARGRTVMPDFSDSAKWLHAIFCNTDFDRHLPADKPDQFPVGGYYLFGANFGSGKEIKGIVDCGPLGYLGIAAHGHADALSIALSVAGEECLIDPGTYSYWRELKWRDYFRGTSAHNTLRVDGVDQSVGGGRFMWTNKANSVVIGQPSSHGQFSFRGTQDGYLRLDDPVSHSRSIEYQDDSNVLVVHDICSAEREHLFEQFWHLAPLIEVSVISARHLRLSGQHFVIDMKIADAQAHIDVLRACSAPLVGWYSRAYEQIEPTNTIRISRRASALNLHTTFTIHLSPNAKLNTHGEAN